MKWLARIACAAGAGSPELAKKAARLLGLK